jgi:FlaA1/EpsC-like NDP-sugar epimerase
MQDARQDVSPIAYLDDDVDLHGQVFLDVPVMGAVDQLDQVEHEAVIVAIGNGRIRQKLFLTLQERGATFAIARHPTTVRYHTA